MSTFKQVVSLVLCFAALAASSRDFVDMDPAEVTAKYGKPDRVRNAANERPRPMIVTQSLEYRKAGVRVTLLSNDKGPPFGHWKLLGYQDIKSNAVISEAEFENRVRNAKKK